MPTDARLFYTLLIVAVLLCPAPVLSGPAQELALSTELSTEGYITLSWNDIDVSNSDPGVVLQIASDPEFHSLLRNLTLYSQQQANLSGFDDGIYYARLTDHRGQNLTSVARFEVKHRSLQTAWVLFSIGLILFSLLLFFVFRYTRPN